MTRDEHLEWAKKRALQYVEAHDYRNAVMSMISDMGKHDSTMGHPGIMLGTMLMVAGKLNTEYDIRKWIEGFN